MSWEGELSTGRGVSSVGEGPRASSAGDAAIADEEGRAVTVAEGRETVVSATHSGGEGGGW